MSPSPVQNGQISRQLAAFRTQRRHRAPVDPPDGPEVRFRHFSQALEAYESNFKQTLRLTPHEADRYVFENLVPFEKGVMSTQPRTVAYIRHGADEFVGRSDILDSTGKPAIVEVSYRRLR